MNKSLGQVAWEAYAESVGQTTFDDKPFPTWDQLGEQQRAGWETATLATLNKKAEAGGGIDAIALDEDQPNLQTHSLKIGRAYLIRTVTMMYTGRLREVTDADLLLEDAAWIADSGRYANALKYGSLSEVEPYPNEVIVARGAIVDCAEWAHELPREQK